MAGSQWNQGSGALLKTRAIEREGMLRHAVAALAQDVRIAAVWLHGSLGRGSGDDWSDIDLWIVVTDDYTEEIYGARRAIIEQIGTPLLVLDVPQNAPAGGAFMSVVYAGEVAGPQHVDFSWQPSSRASVPAGVRVLLNRGVPDSAQPEPASNIGDTDVLEGRLNFFWMMVPVTAKYIARRQLWEAAGLLHMLLRVAREIENIAAPHCAGGLNYPAGPPSEPEAQLALLRTLADDVSMVIQSAASPPTAISSELQDQVYGFLDLVALSLAEPPSG